MINYKHFMNIITLLVLELISFSAVYADCIKGDSKCGVDGQTYICSITTSNTGEWQKKEKVPQNCEPTPYVFSSEKEMKESCTVGDKKCSMDGAIYECVLSGIWFPTSEQCVDSAKFFGGGTAYGLMARRKAKAIDPSDTQSAKSLSQAKDIESIKNFLNSFNIQISELKEDYKKQLVSAGFDNVLNPDKLKNNNIITKSLAATQEAKRIAHVFKATNKNKIQQGRIDLKNLAISEQLKQKVGNEFDYVAQKWSFLTDASWDYELKIISECEPILQILLDNKSHWHIKDKTIVFDDNKYQDAFKTHVANINEFSKKQEWLNIQSLGVFNNRMHSVLY